MLVNSIKQSSSLVVFQVILRVQHYSDYHMYWIPGLKYKPVLNCSYTTQSALYHCNFNVVHRSGLLISIFIVQVG